MARTLTRNAAVARLPRSSDPRASVRSFGKGFFVACGLISCVALSARLAAPRFLFPGTRATACPIPAGFDVMTAVARDGVAVHALHLPAAPGARTIVHFHNNRDTAGDAADLARRLHARG